VTYLAAPGQEEEEEMVARMTGKKIGIMIHPSIEKLSNRHLSTKCVF
jgi:hypothetical protein